VVRGVRKGLSDSCKVVGSGARDEQAVGPLCEATGYLSRLLGRLPLREDDLGQGVAEPAMVIDLGEADVLVRQEAQLFDRRFDARRAGSDRIEEMTKLLLVDGGPSFSDVAAV
jgi:hypothetical protein